MVAAHAPLRVVRIAIAITIVISLFAAPAALAQDPSSFPGHGDDFHGFGPLGAEGMPITKEIAKAMGFERKETALEVKLVTAGGPAERAGLMPGDFIIATSLGPLARESDPTAGPIIQLTLALEAAEVGKGKLSLLVRRDGKDQKFTVEVEKLGAHSRTCPVKCEKCKTLYEKSLATLAALQNPDGSFPMNVGGSGGGVVATTIAGLAMLSSGSTPTTGPYAEQIKKAAAFVMSAAGAASGFPRVSETGANWNQENWELAYAPWFLCEVFHREPTLALKNRLKEIADRLIANMEASGGWAHGPGGPNALDYLELEIMSNYALTALGCMRSVGIEVDQAALDRARDYVVKECTTGDGGVAYSHRPGQKGNGDAGRTAGAYLGLARCDYQDDPMFAKMAAYFMRKDNLHTIPNGHVSPVMHFLAGAMGSWESSPRDFQTCWNTFRSTWRSFRQPDGIFTALPTEETAQLHSNSDRGCGPGWITASYTLIMGIHNDNLPVLLPGKKNGKPIKVEIPVITEAVESPQEPDRSLLTDEEIDALAALDAIKVPLAVHSDAAARNVRSCTGCGICCEYPRNEMKASPLEALAAAVRLRDDPRLAPRLDEITARVDEAVRRYSLREIEDDGRPYTCPLLEPDKTCLVHGKSQPLGCIAFAPVSAERCDMRMDQLETAGIAHALVCDQLQGVDEWPVHAFPVALRRALRLLESRAAARQNSPT